MSNTLQQSTVGHRDNAALTLNLNDVLVDLGGVSPERLLPLNGLDHGTAATTKDLLQAHRLGKVCELVDGILVEKKSGFRESLVAAVLIEIISAFVRTNKLGIVSGADGFIQLYPSLVRGPDIAFISWDRLPGGKPPEEAYPSIVPNLVVEVISPSNTRAEMARKRREYFQAGVELIWMVDPLRRTVAAFTSVTHSTVFYEEQTIECGSVIAGLAISLPEVFAVLDGNQEENRGPEDGDSNPL